MGDRYDLAIIGAGPAGYVAGIRAGQLGRRVTVIEREPTLGGVCLNWGCIPTKALLRNAELVELVRHQALDYGLSLGDVQVDWAAAVARSRRVVQRLTKGIEGLFQKHGVQRLQGQARFVDAHRLSVAPVDGSSTTVIDAEAVIIATGSRSRLLPGTAADGQRILTSRHAVQRPAVPHHLVIIGAGPIGMEFGSIYRAYGAEVTIIEMMDTVLPLEDPEAGEYVARAFARAGIQIHTRSRVEAVSVREEGVRLVVTTDGREQAIEGDAALLAIGRQANVEDLGLEAIGVVVEDGFIKVDRAGRTSVSGVWAAGDVAGPPMLAHKAMHEGRAIVNSLYGERAHFAEAHDIPSCTYCRPQVASIGYTEARARELGYDVRVSRIPFQANGKALAIGDHGGWLKIVADAEFGEILGATIVGPEATELIHELVLARSAELTIEQLVDAVHAHPTLSEAVHEAALGILGAPLHF